MTDLTKEELTTIWMAIPEAYYPELKYKLQAMIDAPCKPKKEMFTCHSGLAVDDKFFCQNQHMTTDDLIPVIHELAYQGCGMIKQSGLYSFVLNVEKLK